MRFAACPTTFPGVAVKFTLPPANLRRLLAQMAAQILRDVNKRAFPEAKRARSIDGKSVPPLSPSYKALKKAAGRGTLPNQRFTSKTANALAVVKLTDRVAIVGFNTERARKIAESLQKRNKFMGLTKREKAKALDIAKKSVKDRAGKAKVVGSIEVTISL